MDALDHALRIDLTVPAEAHRLTLVRRAARSFAETHGVQRPDDVELAIGEAGANVVIHAYHGRPPGALHLHGRVADGVVRFSVADDGAGIGPRAPGGGFGLALMARVASSLELSERAPGTRVTMSFALHGAG